MTVDELNVRVTADIADLRSQMNQANAQLHKFGQSAQSASASAFGGFKLLKSGLAALGIGKIIKDSITDAMNAVESESLFETSLKQYSNAARDWSEKLSEDLGLNGYELRKHVGVLYTMASSMGLASESAYDLSTTLVELSEDMASYYNISSEDAFIKLKSGLTGEMEPLRNIGILVDENTIKQYAYKTGIAEMGAELTQQQKVLARYQAILEQTSLAQGDLARTIESPANQLRVLQNELKQFSIEAGTALMPAAMAVLNGVSAVVSAVKPLAVGVASAIGTVGEAFNALTAPQKNVLVLGLGLCVAVPLLTKAKMALGHAIGFVAGKQLRLMTLLKGGLVAIGLTVAALTLLKGHNQAIAEAEDSVETSGESAEKGAEKASKGVDKLTDSLNGAKKAAGGLAGFDEITTLSGGGKGALTDSLIGSDFTSDLSDIAAGVDDLGAGAEGLTDSFSGLGEMFGLDLDAFRDFWGGVGSMIASGDWAGALAEVGRGLDSLMEGIFGDAYTDVRDYWISVKEVADKEGVLAAIGKVCGDLDGLFAKLFGDSWISFSDFWEGVGKKIASGDWEGAMADLAEGANESIEGWFKTIDAMFNTNLSGLWEHWSDFFGKIGEGFYNLIHAEEISKIQTSSEFQYQYGIAASTMLDRAVVDYLKQGYAAADAVSAVTNSSDLDIMTAWKVAREAEAYDAAGLLQRAETWRDNLIQSGQLVRTTAGEYVYTADDYAPASDSTAADYYADMGRRSVQTGELTEQVSASGVYDAVTAALRNAPISGTVQVTTNFELDGETLGTKMQEFSADQIRRGNGR